MYDNRPYSSSLTAEQFLFYEVRIVSQLYLAENSIEEIIRQIKSDNLFQYPTERKVSKLARACYRRIIALDNKKLVMELVDAPQDIAKQINLYAMMCSNRLIREFMTDIIGEKYRQHNFSYTKKDINVFFSRLREQNDSVAAWSEKTIIKLKQVLTKCLIEVGMLENYRSRNLNSVMISAELENGILENKDLAALPAFNCFKQECDNG